jgi:exopolyphosphatase/guanosine-5'-triphosphate,3'-diphosphate pyrophosphatase
VGAAIDSHGGARCRLSRYSRTRQEDHLDIGRTTIATVSPSPPPPFPRADDVVAVVDLGTNSTRLLVARPGADGLVELHRASTVTSLGSGVDLTGSLSAEAMERTCEAVSDYREVWTSMEARKVLASATSAVRDADNGEAFVAEIRERFDLDARTLSGEEEALLVFRGATAEHRGEASTLVVDIGGGSTEIVIGEGESTRFHTSLQAGVLRHSERHLISDPPDPEELENLANEILSTVQEARDRSDSNGIERAVAVAGTPAALAAIERGETNPDRADIHGALLSLETVQRSLSRLSAMSHAERSEVPGLRADRAPFIVAGTVILIQIMRAFEIDQVEVSESDLMHGLAIEALAV